MGGESVRLDMGGVTFLDSSGISVLVDAEQRLQDVSSKSSSTGSATRSSACSRSPGSARSSSCPTRRPTQTPPFDPGVGHPGCEARTRPTCRRPTGRRPSLHRRAGRRAAAHDPLWRRGPGRGHGSTFVRSATSMRTRPASCRSVTSMGVPVCSSVFATSSSTRSTASSTSSGAAPISSLATKLRALGCARSLGRQVEHRLRGAFGGHGDVLPVTPIGEPMVHEPR